MMSALVVSAFFMGLFGGTHCVAMCGGIAGIVCGNGGRGSTTSKTAPLSRWPFAFAYNVGRLGSYALLGLLFGAVGSLVGLGGHLDVVRYLLRGIAALALLAVGLHLLGLPSFIDGATSWGAPLWRTLAPVAQRLLPLRKPTHALLLGAVWGFMPCGLLYGAFALAASADSPQLGAETMLAFGLGTLPVMWTVTVFAESLARVLGRGWVRRTAGALVLGFGIFTMLGVARQVGVGSVFGEASTHRCCLGRANAGDR